MEYTIIGYYPELETWCLVAVAGFDKDHALSVLKRMVMNPTENDEKLIGTATVLSINTINKEDAWWHDPFLMSD